MPEQNFLNQKRASPTSLAVVISLHALVLGALALSKMPAVIGPHFGPIEVKNIPLQPDPPPEPQKQIVKAQPKAPSHIETVPPIVPVAPRETFAVWTDPRPPQPLQPSVGETVIAEPAADPLPPPKKEPVRLDARLDPRYADRLQPPYPPSEEREGVEGRVTVRVLIGADGRVKSVERVSAASDALYRATERHARHNWRFKPATVDGEPVESRKTMSVLFEIKG